MQSATLNNIVDFKFRTNSDYDLLPWEKLSDSYQELAKGLIQEADFYGLLLPKNSAKVTAKSVSKDSARLLLALQEAGSLPQFAVHSMGERFKQDLAGWVLDDVLQIEWQGRWVGGPGAMEVFCEPSSQAPKSAGKIAELSYAALQYAQALESRDSLYLSTRLYFYNRLPLTAQWRQRFPDADSVSSYLGLNTGDSSIRSLNSNWHYHGPEAGEGWHSWHRKNNQTLSACTHKLYISPLPKDVREVFDLSLDAICRHALSFKIGHNLAGLLRPDKFVVYFDGFESLQATSEILTQRLADFPAQGVPFTTQIMETGMLSWGSDPPEHKNSSALLKRESWRLWVANQLAVALLVAKQGDCQQYEPCDFALERLRLAGVDTVTWTPSDSIWLS